MLLSSVESEKKPVKDDCYMTVRRRGAALRTPQPPALVAGAIGNDCPHQRRRSLTWGCKLGSIFRYFRSGAGQSLNQEKGDFPCGDYIEAGNVL